MKVLEFDLDLEVMEEGQSLAERPKDALVCSREAEIGAGAWKQQMDRERA